MGNCLAEAEVLGSGPQFPACESFCCDVVYLWKPWPNSVVLVMLLVLTFFLCVPAVAP